MNQQYRDATWSLFSSKLIKSHFLSSKSHFFQKIRPKIVENPADKREKKHKKNTISSYQLMMVIRLI